MATLNLQARLSYLTDAAHLLAASAPETSSYLMDKRNSLTAKHGIAISDVEKQHACAACGNILIPGSSALAEAEPPTLGPIGYVKRSGKSAGQPKVERVGITKTVSCDRCARTTVVQLPPAPVVGHVKRHQRAKAAKPLDKVSAAEVPVAKTTSVNAVSKKRAKNRKAGLQALLADSKAAKPSSGLSLASFMKK
ncbi:unnamed protein product [Parascedosporium putredinis]|uniref:Rpr2-domain-containing protein n=1 Tax=Parascedosporium putredinis TaxID=1442378 RepID=A0A9P1M6Y8_9PEZI|nr:unnamed protein product [Parascedosporium putredinis]CAI7990610.1 unnamed protein product [Parascedosporium putredinis]